MKLYKAKLKDLVDLVNGYVFRIDDWDMNGKYQIVRIQNLNNKKAEYNYTNKSVSDKFFIEQGDILISWAASLGAYEWQGGKALLNQHIYKVVFKNNVNIEKKYFKYLLNQVLKEVSYKAIGAGLKHLKRVHLDEYEISYPEIEVQIEQLKTLELLEELITKRKETISLLNEYLEASFYEMFGDQILNPKGWKERKLGSLNISSGSTPTRNNDSYFNGNINWAKSGDIKGKEIIETQEVISEEAVLDTSCKINPKGSILIAMYGNGKTRGSVGLLKVDSSCNQACAVIPPNQYFDSVFLFSQLKYSYDYLRTLGNGGNRINLSVKLLKDYPVIEPPMELQKQFSDTYESIKGIIENFEKSLVLIEELFTSIIYNIFNKKPKITLLDDGILLEEFVNRITNSDYESIEEYNNSKNILYELLEKSKLNPSNHKFKLTQFYEDNKLSLTVERS